MLTAPVKARMGATTIEIINATANRIFWCLQVRQ
jgi:hypothetical protein